MTYYFYDLSFRILFLLLFLKLKGNQVYLFNRATTGSIFIRALGRIPFIKNKLNNLAPEPDIHIGNYKGLYYRINKEAIECTDFVHNRLNLEDYQFRKVYNEKFKTNKFKPFVLKWVSIYVLELLNCLYRVHLDKSSKKLLYLRNNLLNRHIYEWWGQKTGSKLPVKWLGDSEVKAGLGALTYIVALFIYNLLSHRLCLPVRPKKFKIMREAVWGLRGPVFRDDFFVDDEKLLKKDLLLYTSGSSDETRISAYKDAQDSEYECINRSKLKIPLNLLFPRLFKYHFLLPLIFILRNFRGKQNYLLREWLRSFHAVAVNYEILLSHYQIGLGLSITETGLAHIPETIILNNRGSKSVIFHWSDLAGDGNDVAEQFKAFNIYLVWGKVHSHAERNFIDKVVETGCWLKHKFGEFTRNKKNIYQKLGLPINGYKVLAFYDESFHPDIYFTEETLLDFWRMMIELIEEREDVIGLLKPKPGNEKYDTLSAKGKEIFNNLRQRCSLSGRLYFIGNPREIGLTEVMAISDINIAMGMGSPSTIALLCGKIGLYYDTTGNDYHPFTQKYRNKVVFDNKRDLFSAVNKILDEGYNPLDEIEPDLLEDYDHCRDERGLERFREALLKFVV